MITDSSIIDDSFSLGTDDETDTPDEKTLREIRQRLQIVQEAESQNRMDMMDDVRFARH